MKTVSILSAVIMLPESLCMKCTGDKKGYSNQELMSEDLLQTLLQYRAFQYFRDSVEPASGMVR